MPSTRLRPMAGALGSDIAQPPANGMQRNSAWSTNVCGAIMKRSINAFTSMISSCGTIWRDADGRSMLVSLTIKRPNRLHRSDVSNGVSRRLRTGLSQEIRYRGGNFSGMRLQREVAGIEELDLSVREIASKGPAPAGRKKGSLSPQIARNLG